MPQDVPSLVALAGAAWRRRLFGAGGTFSCREEATPDGRAVGSYRARAWVNNTSRMPKMETKRPVAALPSLAFSELGANMACDKTSSAIRASCTKTGRQAKRLQQPICRKADPPLARHVRDKAPTLHSVHSQHDVISTQEDPPPFIVRRRKVISSTKNSLRRGMRVRKKALRKMHHHVGRKTCQRQQRLHHYPGRAEKSPKEVADPPRYISITSQFANIHAGRRARMPNIVSQQSHSEKKMEFSFCQLGTTLTEFYQY